MDFYVSELVERGIPSLTNSTIGKTRRALIETNGRTGEAWDMWYSRYKFFDDLILKYDKHASLSEVT